MNKLEKISSQGSELKKIKLLFETRSFSEILAHNRNCLKNECLVLLKRFIKMYDLESSK